MELRNFVVGVITGIFFASSWSVSSAQSIHTTASATNGPVLWEEVDIRSRDLYNGPLNEATPPALEKVKMIGRKHGGNNLKYEVQDANGRRWVVKIADESQAEVAAVRLLWGIGYRTEVDQIVPRITIENVGSFRNARFEARQDRVKRGPRWSWRDNPYIGTREFNGLKLMMALINNWDLKTDNNTIFTEQGRSYLVISDLGSSFGRLSDKSKGRSGRSVNKPEDFAEARFVEGVQDGQIVVNYRGAAEDIMKDIPMEHARWLADLLVQLSDQQISDAFRAANYSDEDVRILTAATKRRIVELDRATRETTASKN